MCLESNSVNGGEQHALDVEHLKNVQNLGNAVTHHGLAEDGGSRTQHRQHPYPEKRANVAIMRKKNNFSGPDPDLNRPVLFRQTRDGQILSISKVV